MNFALKGRRVELISTSDPYTKLVPGTKGTVVGKDNMETVHIDWDDGSCMGMVPGEDSFRFIDR